MAGESPRLPPSSEETMELVHEALHGLELEPDETSEILSYVNREIPHLQTPEESYLVLGSYRDPYERRLRIVENELNKRVGAYAFLMGDLEEIGVDRLPEFEVEFALLGAYSDYIVGVYEKESGWESVEIGKITNDPYFGKSHVLPRDYNWMTEKKIETRDDVIKACIDIHENDDIKEKEEEVSRVIEEGKKVGVDISLGDVKEVIERRSKDQLESAGYSWVHINAFRLFELHDRCYPWFEKSELREKVGMIP